MKKKKKFNIFLTLNCRRELNNPNISINYKWDLERSTKLILTSPTY